MARCKIFSTCDCLTCPYFYNDECTFQAYICD